ncbi:DUF7010 family protein [Cognataquiflexum aquatile]|uniref:DUF7010 family protein n=1 Tax=Cognataquiflexum aquatile TaxID=2249427 RepID=UPI0013003E3A|nr:hypothetical protein [Cognataquiflexum aquatile]
MVSQENFDKLRIELSVKAKNELNFTLAASIIWLAIAYVWSNEHPLIDSYYFPFRR